MPRYATSSTFRQSSHDELETRFSGGHADLLDSSSTSLHLDEGIPDFKKVNSQIFLYHGDVQKYLVQRMSELLTDDRVHTPHGHIPLSSSAKSTYKAFSKAIDQKLFRLQGDYDCVNEYIRTGLTNAQFEALPVVQADKLCPYYYKTSSLIKGNISYSKLIPPANAEHRRHVTIVNVKNDGALHNSLQDRTLVYLGGNHDGQESALSNTSRVLDEVQRRKNTKYVEYRYNLVQFKPAGEQFGRVLIAFPFPKTWSRETSGVNIGLAKLRSGHFLYWATNFQPEQGKQLCKLPLELIPTSPFRTPEDFTSWPVYDKGARLENIFEGAWALRGDRLVQSISDEEYPEGVLPRLREGFFRERPREVFTNIFRVEARVRKAIDSLERHGGAMFGFDEDPEGIIECDIERLAGYLRFPAEVLLSFMSHLTSSHKYFQGTISFVLTQKGEGKFKIVGPVPVGPWMLGVVTETNSGLLYVGTTEKYFSYETINGVSWLSEFEGMEITDKPKTELGKWVGFFH